MSNQSWKALKKPDMVIRAGHASLPISKWLVERYKIGRTLAFLCSRKLGLLRSLSSERRPNRLNNVEFIKEFDDHLRRESQMLVWMGQFRDSAWTRSELAENMTQPCPNTIEVRTISFIPKQLRDSPNCRDISDPNNRERNKSRWEKSRQGE
jgi:hypothetical protein